MCGIVGGESETDIRMNKSVQGVSRSHDAVNYARVYGVSGN